MTEDKSAAWAFAKSATLYKENITKKPSVVNDDSGYPPKQNTREGGRWGGAYSICTA